ncbi:MAG: hypothetical protein LBS63_01500 [Prevotellaceae bacterium]|nr:hypothetical protein [Prevotellaceae bacterium]
MKRNVFLPMFAIIVSGCLCYNPLGPGTRIMDRFKIEAKPQEIVEAIDSFFMQHPDNRITCETIMLLNDSCAQLSNCQECNYLKEKYNSINSYATGVIGLECHFRFLNSDTALLLYVSNAILYDNAYADVCYHVYIPNERLRLTSCDVSTKKRKYFTKRFRIEFVLEIEKIIAENRKKKQLNRAVNL